MTGIIMGGSARSLLTHMALYGLAAICENAGHTDLRLSWTPGMNPQARIDLGLDENDIAQIVHTHAEQHASPEAWPQERLHVKGSDRGLMSPRIAALSHTGTQDTANHIPDTALWDELQQRRHRVIDHLTQTRQELDLRLLAALGEPCYWRLHADSAQPGRYQDDGASRLEMQPRNQGSEFVGNRLSKVAKKVAERDVQTVRDGLLGHQIHDEAGGDKPDSRSATGMTEPGPADNAIVWCALWGISQTPLTLRTTERARTSICLSVNRREHFYTPLWRRPLHPARLRTLLTSTQMRILAKAGVGDSTATTSDATAAQQWLTDRHVTALLTFPVNVYGSTSAPERRAGQGILHPLQRRA